MRTPDTKTKALYRKYLIALFCLLSLLLAACNSEPPTTLDPQNCWGLECLRKPTAPPQDAISVWPDKLELPCGLTLNAKTVYTTVYVHHKSFQQSVKLYATNLPAGMTASFSPSSTATTSILKLSATALSPKSYTITIEDSRGYSAPLTVTEGNVVNIPDANLASAIRGALNIPAARNVCDTDMLLLTSLGANNSGIANLEGLQYATKLTSLYLDWNSISNLTPLSNLTNLTSLYLTRNSISDLRPLSGLTKLTSLGLEDNSISDITPLSNLTNLTWLDLSIWPWGEIRDITPLSNLTNLTDLGLNGSRVSDLTPLSTLTNLTNLGLARTGVSDITPLSTLTSLNSLGLARSVVSDITALVNNSGLGNGDIIVLQSNPLGLEDPLDPDHQNILDLQNRGVRVAY